MPNIPDQTLQDMLNKIPNESVRAHLSDIVSAKITHEVRCLSKKCDGRLIAFIYDSGQIREVANEKGEMFFRGHRHRLDGEIGFECWCGNDSRLAPQEKGEHPVDGNPPNKEQLTNIYEKIQKRPPQYREKEGHKVVDGFEIVTMPGI